MGDSAASVGMRPGGTELDAATLSQHTVTKAVHEAEDLPVVSENGKVESCVESPQGAPASPASPSASIPCSQSMTPAAAPDTEAQTVTSSQTSHTNTSFESTVNLQGAGGGLQDAVQPQAIQTFSTQSQASQSIQTGSTSQSYDTTINGHQQTSTAVTGQQTFQSVSQSQSVQSVSQTQSAQTVVQSQVAVRATDQPPSIEAVTFQPQTEFYSIDENANSIPERVPAQPQPEPVPEAPVAPEPTKEPVAAAAPQPEPAVITESAVAPEPVEALEPAEATEPVAAPHQAVVPESVAAPEPVATPKPAAAQEPEPAVAEPSAIPDSASASEVVPQEEAAPPQTAAEETVVDAQESASAPEPEPEPVMATQETVAPQQLPAEVPAEEATPALEKQPLSEAEPVTIPEAEPSVGGIGGGGGPVVEEISQEHIKEQLHEIITEIERQVLPEQEQEQQQELQEVQQGGDGGVAMRGTKPSEEAQPVVGEAGRPLEAEEVEYYDEDGVLHHTWKPKGRYNVPKTVVQYEDIVPIAVPEVSFSVKAPPPQPAPPPEPEPPKPVPQPTIVVRQEPSSLTNGAVSPIEIPEGIPLLARILPKDNEEGERKISLERLFTPATDSGDLTPKRSLSKKAFASSSFYRPDHPTIDDQVELAQRISFSLVDENNKMSRGQSMYMKRKKRSMRWIHAGSGEGGEGQEEEHTLKHPPMQGHLAASVPAVQEADTKKPPMKLLLSPKGVQDFHAVQEHYQALMDAAVPTSPEVGKIVAEVQSPTGKGAELFAKRKKRMDKFIVDETTVQKAQTTTRTQQQQQQQQPVNTVTNDLAVKKSAVEERNRQQQQIMEQFLRSREGSLTLVKSPWQAAMETGTPDAAFDDKRQRIKLANTVCERADTKLAEASWLEPPKPMPLVAPSLSVDVTATPAAAPSVPRSMLSPDDSSSKRNSATFNMAAKGWGTYSNFYSPITFAT